MGLQAYLTLAAVVFCIGLFGVDHAPQHRSASCSASS